MEGDDRDDPFSFLAALCHISDSQEDYLSRCSFAGNNDLLADSDSSLSAGRVSTPPYKSRNLPEASSMAVSGVDQRNYAPNSEVSVVDGGRVVNSGRDAELGFHPVVRFSPKSERRSDVNGSIDGKITGLVKDLRFEDASAESSCRRLKISEQILALELASSSTGTTNEKTREDLLKVHDSLKIIIEDMLVETNSGSKNLKKGGSSENRKLKASDDSKDNIRDTENKLYRILPPWSRKKEEIEDKLDSSYREITLLDVLKILKDEDEGNPGDENDGPVERSLLEILKSRGMTFPRPCWWPEEGFERQEKTKKKKKRSR